jgi:hypothetical protein
MASFQAGFNAKGRVNNVAYAFASYTARDANPEQDVTNTEGIPGNPNLPGNTSVDGQSVVPAIHHMEANVRNPCFDVLANPFAQPVGIQAGTFIALRIYVNGVGGVSWNAPSFYVNSADMNGEVRGLQPVAFAGVSDGFYSVPAA